MRRVLRAGWARCPEKEPVQKHGHNKLATRGAATCTVFMNTAPTSTVSMLLSRPVRPKPAVPHGVERGVLT